MLFLSNRGWCRLAICSLSGEDESTGSFVSVEELRCLLRTLFYLYGCHKVTELQYPSVLFIEVQRVDSSPVPFTIILSNPLNGLLSYVVVGECSRIKIHQKTAHQKIFYWSMLQAWFLVHSTSQWSLGELQITSISEAQGNTTFTSHRLSRVLFSRIIHWNALSCYVVIPWNNLSIWIMIWDNLLDMMSYIVTQIWTLAV